jgi:hypothetical protein
METVAHSSLECFVSEQKDIRELADHFQSIESISTTTSVYFSHQPNKQI